MGEKYKGRNYKGAKYKSTKYKGEKRVSGFVGFRLLLS